MQALFRCRSVRTDLHALTCRSPPPPASEPCDDSASPSEVSEPLDSAESTRASERMGGRPGLVLSGERQTSLMFDGKPPGDKKRETHAPASRPRFHSHQLEMSHTFSIVILEGGGCDSSTGTYNHLYLLLIFLSLREDRAGLVKQRVAPSLF